MYPAAFRYHVPEDLDEALALLAEFGDRARPLAGGHSLIPMMKLRLAQPEHVIDLRKLSELRGVREDGGALAIGAATTHWEIESSALAAAKLPLLPRVAGGIADPQVRNRGTIGGSLSHADPAADWPAALLALDAELVCASASGHRTVRIDDWVQGIMTTALRPDELLVEVRVPLPIGEIATAYVKQPHPASRFAVIGVAAAVARDDENNCAQVRVAATGIATTPARMTGVEAALFGAPLTAETIAAAAAHAADGLELEADRVSPVADKAALCRVFARRALTAALQV